MATKADRKKTKRTSTARRRAETNQGGGEFSTLRIPEGMGFFKPKVGTYLMDIVPFIAGEGNSCADKGELHFEKTFWTHPRLGADEKPYVCPAKTGGGKCPVCAEAAAMGKDPDADDKVRKSLIPKQRQLFMVYVHKEDDKKVQLWEVSYHNFGKLLDSRIRNSDEDDGWDMFYFPEASEGLTLKVSFEEETSPFGVFLDVKSIDFKNRKEDLFDTIEDPKVCLDELIKVPKFDELHKIFWQETEDEDDDEKPKKKSTSKKKAQVEDDDEDDEDDDEPAPKKKGSTSKSKKKEEDDDEDDEADAEWLLEQASLADDGDDEAIEALKDRAEAVDLPIKKFKGDYTKLAKAIIKAEQEEEAMEKKPTKPPAKSKKKVVEDDDEDDDDEDDDEPAPKKKGTSKPASKSKKKEEEDEDDDDDDWDDDEDDDDEPAPKKKATTSKTSTKSKSKKKADDDDDDDDMPF